MKKKDIRSQDREDDTEFGSTSGGPKSALSLHEHEFDQSGIQQYVNLLGLGQHDVGQHHDGEGDDKMYMSIGIITAQQQLHNHFKDIISGDDGKPTAKNETEGWAQIQNFPVATTPTH